MTLSPSSREAWIEIFVEGGAYAATGSRLPHGRRGLKSMNPKTEEIEEGRLPHGRRGLKFLDLIEKDNIEKGRLPHGRRGLKCQRLFLASYTPESPSSREAWIEIMVTAYHAQRSNSRLPHGRRGLKFLSPAALLPVPRRRLPHGRRGLKLLKQRKSSVID